MSSLRRPDLANRPHRLRLLPLRHRELDAADVDGQHGEPLGDVVVQLASEQGALLLVGADQAPAQVVQLDLDPLALRESRSHAVGSDFRSGALRLATRARW